MNDSLSLHIFIYSMFNMVIYNKRKLYVLRSHYTDFTIFDYENQRLIKISSLFVVVFSKEP